ncbi:MAG: recombination protein O N-terminal domain-containing protein [Patescibacteria group bacterium]
MKEYVTEAVVLAVRPRGEADRVADMLTKDFGRIEARVVGGRKILSKFSPHLNPGMRVVVRLVKKNVFTLTDVVSRPFLGSRSPRANKDVLPALFLVRSLIPAANPDPKLWYALAVFFEGEEKSISALLAVIGYNARHAKCEACGDVSVRYFYIPDQVFVCVACSVKFPEDALLYITP